MGNQLKKNIYYKGVRPALGVRTRDDRGGNNFIDRTGYPGNGQMTIFADSLRETEDNLFQESTLARIPFDYKWSPNQRGDCAFGDHDDERHDWS
jgi:hypothetical protein